VRVFVRLTILSALLLAAGCTTPPKGPPENIIKPAEFTSLMIQLHLAEAGVIALNLPPDTANALFKKTKADVLTRKKVREADFEKAFQYYSEHPVEMDKIYAAVVDSLSLRESLMPKVN
jgi:hypothetical protein